MKNDRRPSAVEAAAAALRASSLAVPEGTFLGNEEALIARLRVARNTVRQAARLLEREGIVQVRPGINGGYFATRPDLNIIEHAVSAYLSTMAVGVQDVTYIASLLWVEAVRRAARMPSHLVKPMVEDFTARLKLLAPDARFRDILDIEDANRSAIFALTESAFIELVFQINYTFAQGNFVGDWANDGIEEHIAFVQAWRDAKLMELMAIADGDEQLAVMAAQHARNIWHKRFWGA
ncbi:MAG: GntR family transcriptional regulator [Azoarcus sp.]|nr:GntR family transcriptional regulator [Azoarcus sp.]